MKLQQIRNGLRERSRLWPSVVLAVFILAATTALRVARGDTPPELPPPSGGIHLDPITFATNVALGDLAEQREAQAQENARQTALAGTPVSKATFVFPTSPPLPTLEAPEVGILQHPILPSGWTQLYSIVNGWSGVLDGNYITVYSGSKAENPGGGIWDTGLQEQGMVKVDATSLNAGGGRVDELTGDYLTPYRCGPLRVVAEQSNGEIKLLLVSTRVPSWFRFNVTTRVWEDAGIVVHDAGKDTYVPSTPPCSALPPIPRPIVETPTTPSIQTPTVSEPMGQPVP